MKSEDEKAIVNVLVKSMLCSCRGDFEYAVIVAERILKAHIGDPLEHRSKMVLESLKSEIVEQAILNG